jgi:deoxyribonuclease V
MTIGDLIWPETVALARAMQERQQSALRIGPLRTEPACIAGVDAAFDGPHVYAAACLYRYPEMSLLEQATAALRSGFPYVAGYLLFREGPALIQAVRRLQTAPDLILVDGHGIAHPRGIGSASHLGLLLDIPTIGCAKTRLVGEYENPGQQKGSWSRLRYEGRLVGAVLRTRDRVRPVFVSPGHDIDIETAVRITLGCSGRYRIPEPLRCADLLSKRMKAAEHDSPARSSQGAKNSS